MSELRLIAGLGNPGRDYEDTRHNLGFLVVRRLADQLKLKFVPASFADGMIAEGMAGEVPVCLFMPLRFMNNSGGPLRQVVQKKGISSANVLVVCDDFHLDLGNIRIRPGGSDGGHNGLASVIENFGTQTVARLRVGIGQPPQDQGAAAFVLEKFDKHQRARLGEIVDEAAACCLVWVGEGMGMAMEQYNGNNKRNLSD